MLNYIIIALGQYRSPLLEIAKKETLRLNGVVYGS